MSPRFASRRRVRVVSRTVFGTRTKCSPLGCTRIFTRALSRSLKAQQQVEVSARRDKMRRQTQFRREQQHANTSHHLGSKLALYSSAVTQAMRNRGLTVAVLAVDPSSPFSGGALLGDRVRMADHAVDDGVYIRSMATRGHLGGLSWATPHALLVLEAAGFDVVIVETVGVGQAEVEIASIADSTVVVQAPGMGDAVQAAKAGIMEIADIHVVNKADRDGAQRTLRDIRGMLDMAPPGEWTPMVLATTAATGEGVEQLVEGLLAHRRWSQESGRHLRHRRAAARVQVREILLAQVRRRMAGLNEGEALEAVVAAVATRELDPYTAADRLLAEIG